MKRMQECGSDAWNFYGPTEATVYATSHNFTGDSQTSDIIGRPLANTRIFILDQNLRPVPIGVVGDLYIGGHGLARGYLNRPELTAEKFIDLPVFGEKQRLYKSGDLARWLPDGTIEFLGRADFQIKLRGHRIELKEIELSLTHHPAVRSAVVVCREIERDNKRLEAFVVADPDKIKENFETKK